MTGADEAVATGLIVTWIYFFYASSTDYCVDLVMVYRKRRAMGANRIYWLLPLTGSEWPENGKSHPIADITITFDSCRYIMVADGSFRASSSVVAPLCTHLEGQCVIRRTDQTTRYEFSRWHTLEIEKPADAKIGFSLLLAPVRLHHPVSFTPPARPILAAGGLIRVSPQKRADP